MTSKQKHYYDHYEKRDSEIDSTALLDNRAKVYCLKIVLVRGSERMVAGDEDGDGACFGFHKILSVGAAAPACSQAEPLHS